MIEEELELRFNRAVVRSNRGGLGLEVVDKEQGSWLLQSVGWSKEKPGGLIDDVMAMNGVIIWRLPMGHLCTFTILLLVGEPMGLFAGSGGAKGEIAVLEYMRGVQSKLWIVFGGSSM